MWGHRNGVGACEKFIGIARGQTRGLGGRIGWLLRAGVGRGCREEFFGVALLQVAVVLLWSGLRVEVTLPAVARLLVLG